jgi:uncharacterized phage protein (TIGR01671 family)
MREIKFRMWNFVKENPEKSKMFYDANEVMECLKQQCENDEEYMWHGHDHVSEGSVFMQFAGFNDKNDIKIYEGDVLMYIGSNQSEMVVSFKDGCFVGEGPFNTLPLKDYFEALDFESIEVIGNIYQNP